MICFADCGLLISCCKPLKRKPGVADSEVEPADHNVGPSNVALMKGPFQTPPSAKSGKLQKASRTKANKAASQIVIANVGKWEFSQ